MRARIPFAPLPESPRLLHRRRPDRDELWTETVGSPPAVYGERWVTEGDRSFRSFEPGRSKLAAALVRGWREPLPRPGERWLYLGAASGTTASHVADLLGPSGRLYAVERSVRPFARLLRLTDRWPNLLPILADARTPEMYGDRVPIVDGVYADVAQPDQAELVARNLEIFVRARGGAVLLALKTSSMGRTTTATALVRDAEATLSGALALEPALRLDPFYRSHYLIGGRFGPDGPARERIRSSRTETRPAAHPRWPGGPARARRPAFPTSKDGRRRGR